MSRHPSVKWAQRSDEIYITVELPDAQDVKVVLEPEGKFYFSATCGSEKIPYEVDIDLFDKVDVNNSKASVGSRNIFYVVQKTESKWWSRLLKQEGKPPVFLKVDWNKWVDEDDEEQEDDKPGAGTGMDFSNFDFSKLGIGGGEGLDDDMAGDHDDDESDSKEVTEQASADNEPDTKDTVVTDPNAASGAKA
ncbi:co-chaperone protein p23-1 isoform X2 [Cajanus cajan]|uniref:co-chaperone protein p23-1 isoform X2 n=1 Tax=Cajanus cajan TaxID=3821 RepID=UPI00098D9207|nr:co-chaperone protein p23-1 isoform X2 [Cajanus cajan]